LARSFIEDNGSSILTFIDFSREIVTGTLEIIKSGATTENSYFATVMNHFLPVIKPLSQQLSGKSAHEQSLKALAEKCFKLSQELVDLLWRLKKETNSTKWQSVRIALRSMRKKGEVKELEAKLDKYRSEILLRMSFILK